MVFEVHQDSSMLTGDHLLPRITPAIGGDFDPDESPLTSYLDSLQSISEGTGLRILPAHGQTNDDAAARARELITHHEGRLLAVIRSHVLSGASTALAVAERMTRTRAAKHLDSLDSLHAMIAVLEVRAHLLHLAGTGQLNRRTAQTEVYTAA
jgi:glyoxylase-like metal-dependent hydrolase (beta-lactamase superfamily II)